jgi:hypothetical protein
MSADFTKSHSAVIKEILKEASTHSTDFSKVLGDFKKKSEKNHQAQWLLETHLYQY